MNCTIGFSDEMLNHIENNKPKTLTIEMGLDENPYIINCYCLEAPTNRTLVICALCGNAQHAKCVNFKPKPFQDNLYLCPSCWGINNKIDCKATLIVMPLSIINQWINEVLFIYYIYIYIYLILFVLFCVILLFNFRWISIFQRY